MAVFEYEGVTDKGKPTKGLIEAESDRVARQRLRSQGILPSTIRQSLKEKKATTKDVKKFFVRERVSVRELSMATQQLAMLIRNGKPLVGALHILTDQVDSLVLKRTLSQVKERVEQGDTLARALALHPNIFPKLYINMVGSAEASGTLDTVLQKVADYLEAQVELNRKVTGALTYPCIMLVLCTAVIVVLMVVVVPRIVEMFTRQGAKLPLPTRVVLSISELITGYWHVILVTLVLGIFGFIKWYKTPGGRSAVDNLILKGPIFGRILVKVSTARVASTLGALLQSGVGLLDALSIVRNIVENVHFQKVIDDALEGVREGRPLSRELMRGGRFPNMLGHLIASGEETGELDRMLVQAGKEYERDVASILSSLTTLLEPLMLIIVGGIVFTIVISVLLPMADLISVIQK
jgi:general secretion pathway protein F